MSTPGNDTHTGTTIPATTMSKPAIRRTKWATAPTAKKMPDV
jgi:hypothetical protein